MALPPLDRHGACAGRRPHVSADACRARRRDAGVESLTATPDWAAAAAPQPSPPGGHVLRLTSPHGGTIRHAHWRALQPPGVGTVLILPGLGEFIEKYHETVADLLGRGFEVHAIEWYAQGLSTRPLANRHKVHVPDFARHVGDLTKLIESTPHLRDPGRFRMLLAHSSGGHLALRYLHDHPRAFQAAVLASPMTDINYRGLPRWLAQPIAETMCAAGLSRMYVFGVRNYSPRRARFEGNRLTGDRGRFFAPHAWMAQYPELAVGGPTFAWLRAAQRSIRLTEQPGFAHRIGTPILIVAAERDGVVLAPATQRMARLLPDATLITIADARHEILMERDAVRALFWQQFDLFLGLDPAVGRRGRSDEAAIDVPPEAAGWDGADVSAR